MNTPVLDKPIARLMELDQASVFALADIAAERVRQIEKEGWTLEHDDGYVEGEMAQAAACYALHGFTTVQVFRFWPWSERWWKPKGLHHNQVRAGALLVAELARHLRSAPQV
jgi:hypothetical protein